MSRDLHPKLYQRSKDLYKELNTYLQYQPKTFNFIEPKRIRSRYRFDSQKEYTAGVKSQRIKIYEDSSSLLTFAISSDIFQGKEIIYLSTENIINNYNNRTPGNKNHQSIGVFSPEDFHEELKKLLRYYRADPDLGVQFMINFFRNNQNKNKVEYDGY